MNIKLISQKVKQLRELHHLTQDDMAHQLNVSTSSYAKIEQGQRVDLGIVELEKIAQIFNMDLVEFLQTEKYTISITNHNQNDGTQYNHNYCGHQSTEQLQLSLSHKEEIITQLKQELQTLRDVIEILKAK